MLPAPCAKRILLVEDQADTRDALRRLLELTGLQGIDPARCEGELQLRFDEPREATADLVARSLA